MTSRRGASSLGCLFTLLVISAALYFGVGIADAYWKYYQYKDAMQSEVKFRGHLTDKEIREHLRLIADSLGLPPEAGDVTVTRNSEEIELASEYDEPIDLPGMHKEIHFAATASRPVTRY